MIRFFLYSIYFILFTCVVEIDVIVLKGQRILLDYRLRLKLQAARFLIHLTSKRQRVFFFFSRHDGTLIYDRTSERIDTILTEIFLC